MQIKEIKRRLKGIRDIRQITKAMKMVATFRLKKAQQRIEAARPFAQKVAQVINDISAVSAGYQHPLMIERDPKTVCFIIFTSDRGLCGSYNVNIIRSAQQYIKSLPPGLEVKLITIGRKAYSYFKRLPYHIIARFEGISSKPTFEHATEVAKFVKEKYLAGELDQVHMVYSRFYSPLSQKPRQYHLLPVTQPESTSQEEKPREPFIYEPSPQQVLDHLVPRYVEVLIYRALMETDAGENGARMASMSTAVKNAEEIEENMNHLYHQARQTMITRELLEITSGADAIAQNQSSR